MDIGRMNEVMGRGVQAADCQAGKYCEHYSAVGTDTFLVPEIGRSIIGGCMTPTKVWKIRWDVVSISLFGAGVSLLTGAFLVIKLFGIRSPLGKVVLYSPGAVGTGLSVWAVYHRFGSHSLLDLQQPGNRAKVRQMFERKGLTSVVAYLRSKEIRESNGTFRQLGGRDVSGFSLYNGGCDKFSVGAWAIFADNLFAAHQHNVADLGRAHVAATFTVRSWQRQAENAERRNRDNQFMGHAVRSHLYGEGDLGRVVGAIDGGVTMVGHMASWSREAEVRGQANTMCAPADQMHRECLGRITAVFNGERAKFDALLQPAPSQPYWTEVPK